MPESLPPVGFVGFGDQGAPIARAIADGGYPLHVWARRPESLEALDGVAYTVHDSLPALAEASEIVCVCVPEDADTFDVAVDGGLLAHMRTGSVLVNHGTGLPKEARRLAEVAEPYGVEVVDAPVSGGHAVAVARQLTTIVGGKAEVVDPLRPLFDTFSKIVIHTGPVGSGQYGKLFNNALMMMNLESISGVLELAQELELPLPSLLEVLRSGSASSVALQAFGPSITSENAAHLRDLVLIDIDLFSGAVSDLGDRAQPVVTQATAGARGLPELTAVVGA